MSLTLFWIFSLLMLGFAAAVVLLRNPVSSALSLVMSFVGLAALFVMLDAFFIGVTQILVYAGAVMVLFLFIVMLLDLRSERARRINLAAWIGGVVVIGGFVAVLSRVVSSLPDAGSSKPPIQPVNDVAAIGFTLFHNFWFPFEVIGILLVVATIGVVLLSKKELK